MDPLSLKRWNIVTGFIVISCIKMDQIKISLQLETAYPGLSPAHHGICDVLCVLEKLLNDCQWWIMLWHF